MNKAAKKYIETLNEKGIKIKDQIELDDGQVAIQCGWNLENVNIDVLTIFPDDCKYASLRCFHFAKTPENRLGQVMIACNELNRKYKWVKFYVDNDGDVNAEDDAIIDLDTCGEECFELMIRMTQIVKEAYPIVMKAIYG